MIVQICNLALQRSKLPGITQEDYWIMLNATGLESVEYQPSIPQFEPVTVPGRSSPPAWYSGGSQATISFSMTLHRDMMEVTGSDTNHKLIGMEDPNYNFDSDPTMPQVFNPLPDEPSAILRKYTTAKDYSAQKYLSGTSVGKVVTNFDRLLYKIVALNYPVYTEAGVISPYAYMKVGEQLRMKGYLTTSISLQPPINSNRFMVAKISFAMTEIVDIAYAADEALQRAASTYTNIKNATGLTTSTTGFYRYVKFHEPQGGK